MEAGATTWNLKEMARQYHRTLMQAGMGAGSAQAKAGLFEKCLEALAAGEGDAEAPLYQAFVPGRIEFLGKHTDYAGGRSLVTAVDLGFSLAARRRGDRLVRIHNVAQHETLEFSLDAIPAARPNTWTVYPLTVTRRMVNNFPGPLQGAEIAFCSDLPPASGMSSSSAFIIAIFLAFSAVNNLEQHEQYKANIPDLPALAGYLATNENGQTFGTLVGEKGVGTFGGSEDHIGILCSRPGCLVQYRYCPVAYERTIRMPEGLAFVVAVSGVEADKNSPETQAMYNRKSALATHLAGLWHEGTGRNEPHLGAILESAPDAMDRLIELVNASPEAPYGHEELIARLRQFQEENMALVGPGGEALERGDLAELGRLVDRSQELSETWLRNQVPETIFLARAAREQGAHAASAFGAGFGGAVWALVNAARAGEFEAAWQERYRQAHPEAAERAIFRICQSGPAAFIKPLNV